MSEIEISLDLPKDEKLEDFKRRVLDTFKGEVLTGLKEESPVDHGYLQGHWYEEERGDSIEFYNNTFYGPLLVRGTGIYGPHHTPICATGIQFAGTVQAVGRPRALHWFDKSGTEFFRTCVKGIKPNDFVTRGITLGVENAMDALQGDREWPVKQLPGGES